MISVAIKYLLLCFCYLTVFTRLLNIKETNKKHLLKICFSIFFAIIGIVFRTYFFNLRIALLYLLAFMYSLSIYKKGFNITVTSSIISFGMSFCLSTVSIFLIAPIGLIFLPKYDGAVFDVISTLLVGITENILAVLLFKIKRLKNGMPFLLNKGSSDIGVLISISLLAAVTFISNKVKTSITDILIFVLLFGAFIFYLWWRKKLYSDYLKKLRENDIIKLQNTIKVQEEEIAKLTATNEEMAKIIHKDNKLIPTMQAAVNDLISKNKTDEAEKLQTQLNTLHDQRLEVLKEYETSRNLKM